MTKALFIVAGALAALVVALVAVRLAWVFWGGA